MIILFILIIFYFLGESPSSSASDVDNLNNQAALDKPNLLKGAASHAVGNHIVAARNRPTITRLLDFVSSLKIPCISLVVLSNLQPLSSALFRLEILWHVKTPEAANNLLSNSNTGYRK